MAQELKLKAESRREAETWCERHGWQAFIADCRESEAGNPIVGAGIFVKAYINASRLQGPSDLGTGGARSFPAGPVRSTWTSQ